MAEIQISIETRTLERIVWVLIILVLGALVVRDILSGPTDIVRQNSTEPQAAAPSSLAPPSPAPSAAVPNCSDALKNQDETEVDCGGVCRGFWYDGKCNAAPKPECASDADCGAGRECLAGKCVAKPECAADADCAAGEECKAGQCEKKPLSGALDITITSVHVAPGSAADLFKVDSFDVSFDNGLSKSTTLTGKIYYFKGASDAFLDLDRGSIPEVVLSSGEKLAKTFPVPNPVSRPRGKDYTFKVIFEDDGGVEHIKTKKFDA